MNDLLISFYGDDFTGATDAVESLSLAGVKTVLFTAPPTPAQLSRHPGLRAFGVAGTTRAMPPAEMEQTLRLAFEAMRQTGAPIVHYKVCSTFDSSPTVGSIGRAIDVGAAVFGQDCVPVVVGAPSLGRYCVFGNLFARAGSESEPFRLDRHPSMSRHPVTPMTEADLRLHLAKQTHRSIGLLDVVTLDGPADVRTKSYDQAAAKHGVVLIDLLSHQQLAAVGALLVGGVARASIPCLEPLSGPSRLIVGSSGVGESLCAHWRATGQLQATGQFPPAGAAAGPIVAICGSCSPVTGRQIAHAAKSGFVEVPVDIRSSIEAIKSIEPARAALRAGHSVVMHTGGAISPQARGADTGIGPRLGRVLRELLAVQPVSRVLVAGGDTSGQIARALEIESMEMIATLVRGAPLMRVCAPGSPADGIEMTFKGGQIGPEDFFSRVSTGT